MKFVSFLVSTRGENLRYLQNLFKDIENQSYPCVDIVVVLQPCNAIAEEAVNCLVNEISGIPVDLVVSETVGLSASRNLAISIATGDYLLLCDDDCRYPDDAASHIIEAMAIYLDWDIISFKMADSTTGAVIKQYPMRAKKHTLRSLMRISSVEIVLRKHVAQKIPLFDERIGLGTPFITGGENVMLVDAYRRKNTIGYSPHTVVSHPQKSSGFGSCDLDQLVTSKAVAFRRMFGVWGILLAFVFFVRRLFPGKVLRFKFRQFSNLIRGLLVQLPYTDHGA